MNKVATISLASAGALFLFSVAYIGFAKVNGAPMHELPVFGSLFPKPDKAAAGAEHEQMHPAEHAGHETDAGGGAAASETSGHADEHVATDAHADDAAHGEQPKAPENIVLKNMLARREHKADLLDVFKMDSPLDGDEIRELAESLQSKNAEFDRRLAELGSKEALIADRLETLDERQKLLERMKQDLEEFDRELKARAEELDSTAKAKGEQDEKATKALGNLFADGDVDELAKRLVNYGPSEAAKLLATLETDRAKELLDALPQAKWREFAEAYTRIAATKKSAK